MTKLFLFIFLLLGHIAFSQSIPPNKPQLLKIFKASIRQDNSGKVSTNSNPWVICNQDSAFYKSDTIILYNNVNYYYDSKCCDFIDWTFYKKEAFVLTRVQICKEPTTASIAKNEDWFTVRVIKENRDLFIHTYSQGKQVDRFKVLSAEKVDNIGQAKETTDVVKLVRMGSL